MTAPEIRGDGLPSALAAFALRNAVRVSGAVAPSVAAALGRERYRVVERAAARIAGRSFGVRLASDGAGRASGGPYVVVPLHESLVDPLLLAELPLRLRFLARDELFEWEGVGDLLRAGRHLSVPLRPTLADLRQLLSQSRAAVAAGESIVAFPQGSVLGIEIAFQRGALWLAQQLGVPVLPVVLVGTHRVWEYPFSPRMRRQIPVTMRVLQPVTAADEAAWRSLERRMRESACASAWSSPRRFDPERDGYWDGYPYEIAGSFPALATRVRRHRASRAADLTV